MKGVLWGDWSEGPQPGGPLQARHQQHGQAGGQQVCRDVRIRDWRICWVTPSCEEILLVGSTWWSPARRTRRGGLAVSVMYELVLLVESAEWSWGMLRERCMEDGSVGQWWPVRWPSARGGLWGRSRRHALHLRLQRKDGIRNFWKWFIYLFMIEMCVIKSINKQISRKKRTTVISHVWAECASWDFLVL